MNIENLKAFIAVAETKSFSQSAKSLNLTQPAVSKRVAALETHLSKKLFDRIGRSVGLTEAGQVLLPSAKQIQSELHQIEDIFSNMGNRVNGHLIIGTTEYVATRQLPEILESYRHTYPDVDIELQFSGVDKVLEGVVNGAVNFAICPLHKSSFGKLSSNLHSTEIWQCDLTIAVSNSSPLASKPSVSIEELAATAAILPSSTTNARIAIDDQLRKHGVESKVSVETDNFDTMRCMASLGLGWTCLPRAETDDTLTEIHVQGLQFPHSIALISRPGVTLPRAARAFLNTLPFKAYQQPELQSG